MNGLVKFSVNDIPNTTKMNKCRIAFFDIGSRNLCLRIEKRVRDKIPVTIIQCLIDMEKGIHNSFTTLDEDVNIPLIAGDKTVAGICNNISIILMSLKHHLDKCLMIVFENQMIVNKTMTNISMVLAGQLTMLYHGISRPVILSCSTTVKTAVLKSININSEKAKIVIEKYGIPHGANKLVKTKACVFAYFYCRSIQEKELFSSFKKRDDISDTIAYTHKLFEMIGFKYEIENKTI